MEFVLFSDILWKKLVNSADPIKGLAEAAGMVIFIKLQLNSKSHKKFSASVPYL